MQGSKTLLLSTFTKDLKILLPKSSSQRLILIIIMVSVATSLEFIGMASLLPFITALSNPRIDAQHEIIQQISFLLMIHTPTGLVTALAITSVTVIIVSAILRTMTLHAVNTFFEESRADLTSALLNAHLNKPYTAFILDGSKSALNSTLQEAEIVINTQIKPMVILLSQGMVIGIITVAIFVMNPMITFYLILAVGGSFGAFAFVSRRHLKHLGTIQTQANNARFRIASDALLGIKAVKAHQAQSVFLNKFNQSANQLAALNARAATIGQLPRYSIEAVALTIFVVAASFIFISTGATNTDFELALLPEIGIYLYAGYRLLPAAQNIFASAAQMQFGEDAKRKTIDHLTSIYVPSMASRDADRRVPTKIELKKVFFNYPGSNAAAVENLSLTITAGDFLSITGPSGSGKSTILDLILGFVEPTNGKVIIRDANGEYLTRSAWLSGVGYVPQEVFVFNESLAYNVALPGIGETYNEDRVRTALARANLGEFLKAELEDSIEKKIGDGGRSISGGQRQRIGLARALYREPSVLILDEATSALDHENEAEILNALVRTSFNMTVIMVAHRSSAIMYSKRVAIVEEGVLKDIGTHDELQASSSRYRSLVGRSLT